MDAIDIEVLRPVFMEANRAVLALALAIARTLGVMAVFPVFVRAELGGLVRGGIALSMALPMLSGAIDQFEALKLDNFIWLPILAFKEFMLGALIGLLLGVPFWSIQAVGELMDTQRSLSTEGANDPTTKSQASVTSLLLGITSIALFVGANGFQILFGLLYDSYGVWPLARFLPNYADLDPALVFRMLDVITRYMLVVAGPMLMLLLICDICLLFMARAAPQLSVFDLSAIVKNIIFVLFLIVYLPYMMEYVNEGLGSIRDVLPLLGKLSQ